MVTMITKFKLITLFICHNSYIHHISTYVTGVTLVTIVKLVTMLLAITSHWSNQLFCQKSNILYVRLLGTLARFFFYPKGILWFPWKTVEALWHMREPPFPLRRRLLLLLLLKCVCSVSLTSMTSPAEETVEIVCKHPYWNFLTAPTFQRSSNVLWKITIRKVLKKQD